jgi:hypothetical protein
MKNISHLIGNRTHDLLACSAVLQPTVPLHTKIDVLILYILSNDISLRMAMYHWSR